MTIEFFLTPMIGTGIEGDSFRGKYITDPTITQHGCIRYERGDTVVCMLNATQVYLNQVASETDTVRMSTESNLDEILTAPQATTIKAVLESLFIPQELANAGDTRREVIRGIIGVFMFSQRMEGLFGVGWKTKAQTRGVNLNSPWSDFPQVLKDEFIAVQNNFGWALDTLTNASTMREILVVISNEFAATEMFLCGFEV